MKDFIYNCKSSNKDAKITQLESELSFIDIFFRGIICKKNSHCYAI